MTLIAVFAGLGAVLLSVGICIIKRALGMKSKGKENFKLYAIGCTITMPGTILLIFCAFNFIFGIIFT